MSKIYKYASVDSGLKIIESNSVVLNNPQNYNDPFDSIIGFDNKDIDKAISLITEYLFTQEFLKLLNNDNIRANFFVRLFIKWDMLMIKLHYYICRKNKRYDSIPIMKSIIRLFLKFSNTNDEKFKQLKDKFIEEIINEVKEVRNETLISCFSKKNDSVLMWSHYADKHTGICIEFDYPKENFKDVIYSSNRSYFNLYDVTKIILGHKLDDNKVFVNNEGVIKSVLSPFLTKSRDWQYEDEVRCIYYKDDVNVERKDNLTLLYMPNKITGIYCGCRISKENIAKIEELAHIKGIPVYYFKESELSFKLENYNRTN